MKRLSVILEPWVYPDYTLVTVIIQGEDIHSQFVLPPDTFHSLFHRLMQDAEARIVALVEAAEKEEK